MKALEIIAKDPDRFQVEVLTAHSNIEQLIEQATTYQPNVVVVDTDLQYEQVKDVLWDLDIKTYVGEEALEQVVQMEDLHLVVNALAGMSSVTPTLSAVKSAKPVAIVSKEPTALKGKELYELVSKRGVTVFPLSLSNGGVFQNLAGEFYNPIAKLTFTVKDAFDPDGLTKTLLEILEARWLFNLRKEQIELIEHPEGQTPSMVHFADGTIKTIIGVQDQSSLLSYALNYPYRVASSTKQQRAFEFTSMSFKTLHDEAVNIFDKFKSQLDSHSIGSVLLEAKASAEKGELSLERLSSLLRG